MARLSLSLLGPFQATLDGTPVMGFESNKVRALLAYLAVESSRPHSREALAGLLWPERPNPAALGNLRHALANLRRALGDAQARPAFLRITRETLQFNPASDHWLDIADFGLRISDPSPPLRGEAEWDCGLGTDRSQSAICNLQSAIELYRGRFLEGLAIEDSPVFEEWALLKRAQLEREMLGALQYLADYHEARGEYAAAQAHVRRQLALEPWREEAHRQLMRLLALDGQRGAALAHYETCRRLLADELGVQPERATVSLMERIRDGEFVGVGVWEAPVRAISHAPTPPYSPTPTPFVAREHELAQLAGYLDQARAGAGRVVFVIGEAGSGKTALVKEFARRALATHDELVVAGGRCNAPTGSGDPYLPF
ncbi:MAG: AAA family ATPase, partial [Chloroflexi bacterium]|nr:AAA family ATPase [Chloroflexota bacterium]